MMWNIYWMHEVFKEKIREAAIGKEVTTDKGYKFTYYDDGLFAELKLGGYVNGSWRNGLTVRKGIVIEQPHGYEYGKIVYQGKMEL
jgi:hypothetical protein